MCHYTASEGLQADSKYSILFIRRIVQIYFTRQGDKEGTHEIFDYLYRALIAWAEQHLVTLRKQQREKIEEIKKKTNYYTTRTLIERYGEATPGPGTEASLRRRVPAQANPSTPPKLPSQLQQGPQGAIPQTPVRANGQLPPGLQQQLSRKLVYAST